MAMLIAWQALNKLAKQAGQSLLRRLPRGRTGHHYPRPTAGPLPQSPDNCYRGRDLLPNEDIVRLGEGTWIHAAGEFADEKGEARRAAVSIGPEHGTVGSDHVTEAAKEAVKGAGFDLLLVLGFAFDAPRPA